MLLTAADLRRLILLAGTVVYVLLQGRAESRRWSNRQREFQAEPGAAADGGRDAGSS